MKRLKLLLAETMRKIQINGYVWLVPGNAADVARIKNITSRWTDDSDFSGQLYSLFGDSLLLDALDRARRAVVARKAVGQAVLRLIKSGRLASDPNLTKALYNYKNTLPM